MKKILLITGLFLALLINISNPSFASTDVEKVKIVSEIGTLSNNQKYTEALDKCNSALKKYPNDYELYYWSATIKSSMGNKKAALEDYDKVIKLNPKDANAYVMRGICKSDLGDPASAIEDFNKALAINPKDISAYSMRACSKIDLGDMNGANEDLNIANKLFDESTQVKPKETPSAESK